MNQNQTQAAPNVDLKNTTSIETPKGNKIFQQGVILRQVSKFVVGASEDAILPIPVFYDPETGKVLEQTLPKELREEFKDQIL
tara:strand:+ start:8089 stop:8337 length:249 start_codon:yes stop_codon:yes gene_type:complete